MRPKLAVAFAEAIEEFAVCEAEIGAVYLVLNAHRPDDAYAELEASVTFSSRIQMVESCAKSLAPEENALVLAVTDRASSASKQRNKIAHCNWGYSDALPNSVLQCPARSSLFDIRERLKGELGTTMTREDSASRVMVYNQEDFESVRLAALNAAALLAILASLIMSTNDARAYMRRQILSDPQTKISYEKWIQEIQLTSS